VVPWSAIGRFHFHGDSSVPTQAVLLLSVLSPTVKYRPRVGAHANTFSRFSDLVQ
jgi:hypothetical protein